MLIFSLLLAAVVGAFSFFFASISAAIIGFLTVFLAGWASLYFKPFTKGIAEGLLAKMFAKELSEIGAQDYVNQNLNVHVADWRVVVEHKNELS